MIVLWRKNCNFARYCKRMEIMRKVLFFVVCALLVVSCKKKQEVPEGTIITTIEETKVDDTPRNMGDRDMKQQVAWGGKTYTVSIKRRAESEMATVKDQTGNVYYDNRVEVVIDGPEGDVLNHVFRKGDFASYIDRNYIKTDESALISVVYKEVGADGQLKLVATVGSPDEMDDNFMMIEVSVSKGGSLSCSRIEEEI